MIRECDIVSCAHDLTAKPHRLGDIKPPGMSDVTGS
jgi:hypothetical protein